ncbi:MAG: hypothetical protein KF832_22810 [Caldilineaceae bacterium]|nr:hypothetical protein [Caldilineaceae bacterium]
MNKRINGVGEQLLWWVLYLVGWLLTSALALWLILQLRLNLIDLNNFLGWGPWILIGLDKFGFVLLGLGWLIGVFVMEAYLRTAKTIAQVGHRLGRLLLIVGGALAVSYALQWLLV